MAFRKIHDQFWLDVEMEDWSAIEKYFYLYLITNPFCNQIGVYEFSIKHASLHTGIGAQEVEQLLERFEYTYAKIVRSTETREIVIRKFYHHNRSSSPKLEAHCRNLISAVKDRDLIQYVYDLPTVSKSTNSKAQQPKAKEQPKAEPDLVYPWPDQSFHRAWSNYKTYKKQQFQFTYKSKMSEQAALTQLSNMAETVEDAIEIIMQSIGNGWRGLFRLTKGNERETTNKARDIAVSIAKRKGLV